MAHILLHFPSFYQNAGSEELLSEVTVIDLDTEYSLQKILQLAYGKLLRKKLESDR